MPAKIAEGTIFFRPSHPGWEPPTGSTLRRHRGGDFSISLDDGLAGSRTVELTAVIREMGPPVLDFEGDVSVSLWLARPDGVSASSIEVSGSDPYVSALQELWIEVMEATDDDAISTASDCVSVVALPHEGGIPQVVKGILTASSQLRQAELGKAFAIALSLSPNVCIQLAARQGIAGVVIGREMLAQLAVRNARLRVEAV